MSLKASLLRNLFRRNTSQKQGYLIAGPSLYRCPLCILPQVLGTQRLSSQQESTHQVHCFHLSSHQLLPGPQHLVARDSVPRERVVPLLNILLWFSTAFTEKVVPCSSGHEVLLTSPPLHSLPTDPQCSSWVPRHRLPARIVTSVSSGSFP